jgi:methionyl-tRNA synthetase
MNEETISFREFKKLDIRVGSITDVEKVTGSDKLYKMQVDIGEDTKQIIAGLAEYYTEKELKGKMIILVVNLKPAKIFGQMSYGMLLAAEKEEHLALLTTDKEIPNGAKIT